MCDACHLEGGASSVFGYLDALMGVVSEWRCNEEAVSSSYSTLTPNFSVFSR